MKRWDAEDLKRESSTTRPSRSLHSKWTVRKTVKYSHQPPQLCWELKQQFPGIEVKQHSIIDALGGWSQEMDTTMYEILGSRRKEVQKRMQKAVLSVKLNSARTFKVFTWEMIHCIFQRWNNCCVKNAHKISRILPGFICKRNRFQLVFNFEQMRTVTLFGEQATMAHIPRWVSAQSSRITLSNISVFNNSNETIQKSISLKLSKVLTTQNSRYFNLNAQVGSYP